MKQPKEIATELVGNMYAEMKWFSRGCAKKCAIICCNEIIKTHKHKDAIGLGGYSSEEVVKYWQAVKKQLNNGN